MKRKYLIGLGILAILIGVITLQKTAKAESFAEWCQRIQKESDEEYMNKLEKDGNLTDDSIKALSRGKTDKKANKTYKSYSKTSKGSSSADELNKGYVYECDELHVVGLPTNEKGYTKAGDYGKID